MLIDKKSYKTGGLQCVLLSCLLSQCVISHAGALAPTASGLKPENGISQDVYKKMIPKFLYSYIEFDFDSTSGSSYNKYFGQTNFYGAGVENIRVADKTYAGLTLFQIDSHVKSDTRLNPFEAILSKRTIANNMIFMHFLRNLNQSFSIDVQGSYGHSNVLNNTLIMEPIPLVGISRTASNSGLFGLTGSYHKPFKKVRLSTSVGSVYNYVRSGASTAYLEIFLPPESVRALTTQTVLLFENAELGYRYNNNFTPFVNGGLVQVPYFANSRAVVNSANLIGTLPQLVMNLPAYRLGAGISINRKYYSLRLEQKYYNAKNILVSNTTSLGINFKFS